MNLLSLSLFLSAFRSIYFFIFITTDNNNNNNNLVMAIWMKGFDWLGGVEYWNGSEAVRAARSSEPFHDIGESVPRPLCVGCTVSSRRGGSHTNTPVVLHFLLLGLLELSVFFFFLNWVTQILINRNWICAHP
jgi:hypothetical protein